MGVSQIGGTTYNRLATKQNAVGELSLGTASVTTNIGTTAWGQVTASLAADTLVTAVQVTLSSGNFANGSNDIYLEIGIGGASSEATVAMVPLVPSYNASWSRLATGRLSIPVRVASGQRLAVRLTDSSSNSATASVRVFGAAYANVEGN